MGKRDLSQEELKKELSSARKRIRKLEKLEAEHQKIEKALRESEELYRALLETLPDSVTVTDLDGKIIQPSISSTSMIPLQLHRRIMLPS